MKSIFMGLTAAGVVLATAAVVSSVRAADEDVPVVVDRTGRSTLAGPRGGRSSDSSPLRRGPSATRPAGAPAAPAATSVGGSGVTGGTSILRFKDSDPKSLDTLAEDINVMALVLEKSVERAQVVESAGLRAGGVPTGRYGARLVEGLYLEGFGAVFTFQLPLPLAPPAHAPKKREEGESGSDWEAAKNALYGSGTEGDSGQWADRFSGVAAYDDEKIEQLKKAIVEALKNAGNIRDLKPEESVVVAVFGGATLTGKKGRAGGARKSARSAVPESEDTVTVVSGRAEEGSAGDASEVPARATVMTFRVQQSDAIALRTNKLTAEEFAGKVTVHGYLGTPRYAVPAGLFGGSAPMLDTIPGTGIPK